MTFCHFIIRQGQKSIKIGKVTIFGQKNSNMSLVFEIDVPSGLCYDLTNLIQLNL